MNEPQDLALANLLQLMKLKFVGILQAQRANVGMFPNQFIISGLM
jgi:hypothetical protein